MFVVRVYVYPTMANLAEARAISEQEFKARQKRGMHDTLQWQLFSDGPVLMGETIFDTLADYEQTRKDRATDPEWLEASAKLLPLISRPPRTEIFEFIVPPVRAGCC